MSYYPEPDSHMGDKVKKSLGFIKLCYQKN